MTWRTLMTAERGSARFGLFFAAVFAVAVWPARCTVAVNRGACAGLSVWNSHTGGA